MGRAEEASVRGQGFSVGFRTLGCKGPMSGRLWALGAGVLGSRLTFGEPLQGCGWQQPEACPNKEPRTPPDSQPTYLI